MRTPEEIKESIDTFKFTDYIYYHHSFMLEIMCNIAITLDKISKEMNNDN